MKEKARNRGGAGRGSCRVGWRGTDSWGMLFEFTVDHVLWPSYGMLNFDAATTNSLRLGLHTGLTPNPGSSSYNSAYQKWVTLLGPGHPGRWSTASGSTSTCTSSGAAARTGCSRSGTGSTVSRGSRSSTRTSPESGALIQVAPHPTLLYNTQNGAPGEDGKPGLALEGGFYRANTAWTNEYWWDGMRRRQSEASILAGFPKPVVHGRHRRGH